MITTIEVNNDIKEKLLVKSKKSGIKPIDLANEYILDGLEKDNEKEMSLEEIDKLLTHDNPSGETGLEEFIDSIDLGYETNSVEIKKQTYRR